MTHSYYRKNAEALIEQYNSVDSAKVHAAWKHLLPDKPGLAADIGAGSGRDANWLASMGWDVVAVEPCKEMRELAQASSNPRVTWLDEKLPELRKLLDLGSRFNLILIGAVWMHLTDEQRSRAFRTVSDLLAPNGLLVITLRQEDSPTVLAERGFHPCQPEELLQLARVRALAVEKHDRSGDTLGRDGVTWDILCFRLPDDGTGSLPLLRHIIVNDNKSASYKLGMLRALLRAAEGAPGMVLKRTETHVDIPFGILGLYWLKLYLPLLVTHNIRQQAREGAGYLFATEDFYALKHISSFDLRVGARFVGAEAKCVVGAIAAACRNIARNPANFTTFPGTNRTVFQADYRGVRRSEQPIQLDRAFLSRFGTFRVPADIWQTLGQYTCWLEPAIVNEWVSLMTGWELRYDRDTYYRALEWEEGRRDTGQVRGIAERLRESGDAFRCVWTNAKLAHKPYAIDHCFPWSRWFNNDLWNLVPSTVTANTRKSDKLPSAELARKAEPRILSWWEEAYASGDLSERFFMEAEAALPLLTEKNRSLDKVFEAMLLQRQKLKANQQLAEWSG